MYFSQIIFYHKDKENCKVQFFLLLSSWLSQTSSLFQAFLAVFMECLAWIFKILIISYSWVYL